MKADLKRRLKKTLTVETAPFQHNVSNSRHLFPAGFPLGLQPTNSDNIHTFKAFFKFENTELKKKRQ